jgi:hypothetical protein
MSLTAATPLLRRLFTRRVRRRPLALAALIGAALIASTGLEASDRHDRPSPQTIVFTIDVAEDFSLFVPTKVRPEDTQPERGAFFVTEGRIFPGGTIPKGGTPEAPGTFDPNAGGAIGTWFCRGTHLVSGALFPVTARAVHTSQMYLLPNEGKALSTDGLEGAGATVRPVTGGTGPFAGYVGEQRQELIGFNASGGVNLRVTFILRKV